MTHNMSRLAARTAWIACIAVLLVLAPDARAQKKKKKKGQVLGEAVVHVLDSQGAPVGGIEVILDIERPDGTHDRRLGLTGQDGDAHFRDVRVDCVQVRASVRAEGAGVEGQPRPCGERVEAFVVVPAAAPAPPEVVESPQPPALERVPGLEPVSTVVEEPEPTELEPEPESAAEPAPEPVPEIPPEEQPFELRARLGPDICAEIFYEPAEKQRTCDDTDVLGFGVELDAAFHFEEWLLAGVMIGYRYFGSQAVPLDAPEDDQDKKRADNHLLLAGAQLRLSWMLSKWVLTVDAVPVGISHLVIGLEDEQFSINEFFITLSLVAAYRFGKGSWIGVYTELLQPMPWAHSDIFRPATISAGVLLGTRLGPQPDPDAARDEATAGDEEDASTGDALMRRRLGDI